MLKTIAHGVGAYKNRMAELQWQSKFHGSDHQLVCA